VAADKALAAALRLRLVDAGGLAAAQCRDLEPEFVHEGTAGYLLGPGTFRVDAGPGAGASWLAERFSGSLPVKLGRLDAGGSATLVIPADRATRAWTVEFDGQGGIRACG
jgi:hypothetical protein